MTTVIRFFVFLLAPCFLICQSSSPDLRQDGSLTRRDLDDGNDERLGDALSHYEYVRTDVSFRIEFCVRERHISQ